MTPWTAAHQSPLSMRFSGQGYWSGLSFPSPRDLPNPGIEPKPPTLQADSLPAEPPGKPHKVNAHRVKGLPPLERTQLLRHLQALPDSQPCTCACLLRNTKGETHRSHPARNAGNFPGKALLLKGSILLGQKPEVTLNTHYTEGAPTQ